MLYYRRSVIESKKYNFLESKVQDRNSQYPRELQLNMSGGL